MVRALFDERKTQTRRLIRIDSAPERWEPCTVGGPGITDRRGTPFPERAGIWDQRTAATIVSKWAPGDLLYVKETHRKNADGSYRYLADYRDPNDVIGGKAAHEIRWSPSIFMPFAAARLFLRVTSVRAERLQAMSAADALAEGVEHRGAPLVEFQQLWDSLNALKAPWASSPWVWAISFVRVTT
jgi:hypothetical protein